MARGWHALLGHRPSGDEEALGLPRRWLGCHQSRPHRHERCCLRNTLACSCRGVGNVDCLLAPRRSGHQGGGRASTRRSSARSKDRRSATLDERAAVLRGCVASGSGEWSIRGKTGRGYAGDGSLPRGKRHRERREGDSETRGHPARHKPTTLGRPAATCGGYPSRYMQKLPRLLRLEWSDQSGCSHRLMTMPFRCHYVVEVHVHL